MNSSRIVLTAAVLCLPACTWVEPTKEGGEVVLVKAFNVDTCKKLGTTTTSVKHKVGIIARSEEKVTEELIVLAKNKAAEMGGDSIVATGEPIDGSMSFGIYKCSQ